MFVVDIFDNWDLQQNRDWTTRSDPGQQLSGCFKCKPSFSAAGGRWRGGEIANGGGWQGGGGRGDKEQFWVSPGNKISSLSNAATNFNCCFLATLSFQQHHRAYKQSTSLHLLISQKLNWISYTLSASGSAAAAQAREKERVARRIMARGTKGSKLAIGPGSTLFNRGKSMRECPGGGTHPRGAGTEPRGQGQIIPRGSQISIPAGPPGVAKSKWKIQFSHLSFFLIAFGDQVSPYFASFKPKGLWYLVSKVDLRWTYQICLINCKTNES